MGRFQIEKELYQIMIFRCAEEANPCSLTYRKENVYLFDRRKESARKRARSFVRDSRTYREKGVLNYEIDVVPVPLIRKEERPAGYYLCTDGSLARLHVRS